MNLAKIYLEEAEELFNQIEESLLLLESSPGDYASIAEVFRSMHTLKGNSAMFGLDKGADFLHDLETIYDLIRSGDRVINQQLMDFSFRSLDHLRNFLSDPKLENGENRKRHQALTNELAKLLQQCPETKATEAVSDCGTYHIYFKPSTALLRNGSNPLLLMDEMDEMGKYQAYPLMSEALLEKPLDVHACHTAWNIILSTTASVAEIDDVFIFVKQDADLVVTPISDEDLLANPDFQKGIRMLLDQGKKPELGAIKALAGDDEKITAVTPSGQVVEASSSRLANRQISSIRVPSQKLDELMNHVSELVTTQASLSLFTKNNYHPALDSISDNVEKLSRQLRDVAFGMTLVSVDNLFGRFQRLVRDLSVKLDKPVQLITDGNETELDKTIIENLTDPIMHMIRNCMDHGIESTKDRLAKGKPKQGTIKLKAYYSGAKVFIQIQDDGKGIDVETVRKKAVSVGLISDDQRLPDEQIYDLLFSPGFSMASKVTEVSGRGIGMDVVKKKISEIRGDVTIESEKDIGTTIKLSFPLTLSVIDGLLVQVNGISLIVSLLDVYKCFEVSEEELNNDFNQLIILDGTQVPYIDLRVEFDGERDQDAIPNIVVVQNEIMRIAICVDHIVGEYQAVLKPISKYYRHQEFVSGATILGDGTVALVLDAYKLIKRNSNQPIKI